MTRKDATDDDSAADVAARWFVRVDAGERGVEAELTSWLEQPENERALTRVELAAALGERLAADPQSALYAEAAEAARVAPPRRTTTRVLAWGGALAAALLVAVLVVPDSVPPADVPAPRPLLAAARVAVDPPSSAVAILPTGVVVDAGAVAVLPFAASGDATLAEDLQRDVVAALRTVPGLYVIADAAVSSYASTDLSPSEIGTQLGARGIVDAGIELVDGRVRVSAWLRDAATGAFLWRTDVDRPVDELSAIRYEIAENVAATMLDSDLREQAARAAAAGGPVSVSKPLLQ